MIDNDFAQIEALGAYTESQKPRYGMTTVSDDLTLNYDLDDTWVSINAAWADECDCVMIGLSEVDTLIARLQEVKVMLTKNERAGGVGDGS